MKAIVTVVSEAYGQLEQAASVFLAADDVEDTTMARVRTTLSDDLASTFRPSTDRISGDPGASIALGRFNLEDNGRLTVVASFVQDDGTGRGCTQYTLNREGDDWVVSNTVDAWPDCPISSQGDDSYRDALERVRSDVCTGLWANIGTCGEWLFVAEGLGYGGMTSYYDPQTGLIVAQEVLPDDAGMPGGFVFGSVDCESTVAETIPCDR